ncbi:uncharacterized protein LOC116352632 [Contarinia nasturtii]|uniref:uncharacterized protein LOC116352632 n=1 Tax=Contarinia nasturtii TaxID=265458 RepID=UPI0012D3ED6B|nr:uncharacterized protein LOC116352632 [Contarinia nasturtii]
MYMDEILVQLKNSINMDFCGDLANIQSIFNYAHEYIKPLNKIQFRGGNEPYIAHIVTKVLELFNKKGYFDTVTSKPQPEFDAHLRKIAFYLVLNTEATFKYDLKADYSVCHLLNTLPSLPKALLHACIWGVHLERYFCECIAYTPIWFAYQFIDNVVESLKYADPYETLDRVDQLLRAIYTNIVRSDFRQMEAVDKKIILNKYFDVATDLMRHFYSPDVEKFQKWSKNKYRKYMGFVLKHNLNMILDCFKLFRKRPMLKSEPIECDIYALMREREPLIDDHRESYTDAVQETLHRMNTMLLNSLQYNVMQVDCNAFMYWVEIDINDEYTLQRVVGEAAYKVEQMINLNECFTHDVSAQLKSVVIKPPTVAEMIARIETIGEWIEKLEKLADTNDENIELWINGFIDHGELVLGNTECLEALEMHATSLTIPIIKRLILFASNAVNNDEGCIVEEKLIEICLNSFDQFTTAQIFELIQYSIDEQKSAFGNFQLDNFDQFLIEVFNKTTFKQNQNAYLKLLFQNPQLFYAKLFDEALTTDMQMQHMMEILDTTKLIFKNYAMNQVDSLIERETTDAQEILLLPKLLANLFFIGVLKQSELIVDIFYKRHLVDAMKKKCYNRLELLITTLNIIAVKFKFEGMCPPLLVMSSQVLELCRWNLAKFTDQLVSIVTKTIELINVILKVFLPTASQNEKSWIISKLTSYGLLTRYYFQKLTLPKERSPKKFDEFIWPSNKSRQNQQECVTFLCEYLVRCTNKEISWLAKNDSFLPHFWEAFELVSTIAVRSNQENEINCLKYCSNAFLWIFQKHMLTSVKSDIERANLLTKLIKLLCDLNSMPFFGDLVTSVQAIIVSNIEKCNSNDSKEVLKKSVQSLIIYLRNSETKMK